MSRRKGVDVRILNPAAGRGYTSRKCAERYVRRGVARWVKDSNGRACLEFLAISPVSAAVARSVARDAAYDRVIHTGLATLEQMAALPMISPGVALKCGRRKGASRRTFRATEGF